VKTLGIIGGIAPESTVEYYRGLVAAYRERVRDGSYPSIVIDSIDLKKMLDLIGAGALEEVTDYLAAELGRLARAGASLALLASNTPHVVFDELRRRSAVPLVSIVEAACGEAKALGLRRVGLFGTRFTMQGRFYPDVFSREGIELVAGSGGPSRGRSATSSAVPTTGATRSGRRAGPGRTGRSSRSCEWPPPPPRSWSARPPAARRIARHRGRPARAMPTPSLGRARGSRGRRRR
jgi:hypothetical protein